MMKCPYQTIVIHKPEYTEGFYIKQFAMDVTQFGDCIGEECPYYSFTGRCLKAESEVKDNA